MKRLFDLVSSLVGLIVLSPLIGAALLAVYLSDRRSPWYFAPRVGRHGRIFSMIKVRSMIVGADRSGIDSTAASDSRITPIGRFVRRFKIDELPQLLNVLTGDMSLVGPRPNTAKAVEGYTESERRLLSVRPGITDLSSIVFSDEGQILAGSADPDGDYDRMIRPWKSRLSLFYIEHGSFLLDLRLVLLTLLNIVSRQGALAGVTAILIHYGADPALIQTSQRNAELVPSAPPGAA